MDDRPNRLAAVFEAATTALAAASRLNMVARVYDGKPKTWPYLHECIGEVIVAGSSLAELLDDETRSTLDRANPNAAAQWHIFTALSHVEIVLLLCCNQLEGVLQQTHRPKATASLKQCAATLLARWTCETPRPWSEVLLVWPTEKSQASVAEHFPGIVDALAVQLDFEPLCISLGKERTRASDLKDYLPAKPPADIARHFGCTVKALTNRKKAGKLRYEPVTSKAWRVHKDDWGHELDDS